ncbi:hypothetical protein I0C86_41100 [Plantactinospora sp. S1510]|uniref:Uncharacterized protein n=1 Tax=Plantactinospora alkalitolerans TaxID=2789879 RepID=A0ABS0H9V5_9ACTN|nr:hypothetical protein [Plantactinospora alkalitolerans]MBF9135250.1 hypothetical protein [Plantactinospora alkalitolerans]
MYLLRIYDEPAIEAACANGPAGLAGCDWCGDDLAVHVRLVVQLELDRSEATVGHRVVACDRSPRTWQMWARRQEKVVEGREFMCFGDEQSVHRPWTGRGEPTGVLLTEDPEGQYYGWIKCEREVGHEGVPVMIQPHPAMFRMQEPGGFYGRVKQGRGEVVRMSVKALS